MKFARHPGQNESPWYEPEMEWKRSVERNVRWNRRLVLISLALGAGIAGFITVVTVVMF